jgi:hypothetical protein
MLMKRIRASGDKEPVAYDPDKFSLTNTAPSWNRDRLGSTIRLSGRRHATPGTATFFAKVCRRLFQVLRPDLASQDAPGLAISRRLTKMGSSVAGM